MRCQHQRRADAQHALCGTNTCGEHEGQARRPRRPLDGDDGKPRRRIELREVKGFLADHFHRWQASLEVQPQPSVLMRDADEAMSEAGSAEQASQRALTEPMEDNDRTHRHYSAALPVACSSTTVT